MGLLDNVLGMAQQALGQGQGTQGSPDLMSAVLGMVSNDSAHGGIGGLVQAFQNGGLGNVVQSWIGTGQNLPISAEQLQSVLGGSGPLAEMAKKLGLNESEAAMRLSQVLPGLVDQLTPQGQVPQGGLGSLAELAGQLLGGHKPA
jgi:uncharacterized protein YidB (DUF937 family)